MTNQDRNQSGQKTPQQPRQQDKSQQQPRDPSRSMRDSERR